MTAFFGFANGSFREWCSKRLSHPLFCRAEIHSAVQNFGCTCRTEAAANASQWCKDCGSHVGDISGGGETQRCKDPMMVEKVLTSGRKWLKPTQLEKGSKMTYKQNETSRKGTSREEDRAATLAWKLLYVRTPMTASTTKKNVRKDRF